MTPEASLGFSFVGAIFYEGQASMGPKKLGVTSVEQLDGATFFVQPGTVREQNLVDCFSTAFFSSVSTRRMRCGDRSSRYGACLPCCRSYDAGESGLPRASAQRRSECCPLLDPGQRLRSALVRKDLWGGVSLTVGLFTMAAGTASALRMILPQVIRIATPAAVNVYVGAIEDTSRVGILDPTGAMKAAVAD